MFGWDCWYSAYSGLYPNTPKSLIVSLIFSGSGGLAGSVFGVVAFSATVGLSAPWSPECLALPQPVEIAASAIPTPSTATVARWATVARAKPVDVGRWLLVAGRRGSALIGANFSPPPGHRQGQFPVSIELGATSTRLLHRVTRAGRCPARYELSLFGASPPYHQASACRPIEPP